MHVSVYWKLATQHDVCWLISHGQKTFFPKSCQLLSLLQYLCVPACAYVLQGCYGLLLAAVSSLSFGGRTAELNVGSKSDSFSIAD